MALRLLISWAKTIPVTWPSIRTETDAAGGLTLALPEWEAVDGGEGIVA